MLLHRKLSVILFSIVVFTSICIYFASVFTLKTYSKENTPQYKQSIVANVSKDIDTFEIILETVEQKWDAQLTQSLPLMALRIAEIADENQQVITSTLHALTKEFAVSNLYIIDESLTVVASTLKDELGLDMSSFSPQYTQLLTELLNQGDVKTHRMSHATNTGVLKKYAYFSLPGSNIIINADINVKERLKLQNDVQLSTFLFGDYVRSLEEKYAIINSIDLILLSDQDAFSLFFEGRKVDRSLFDQRQESNNEGSTDASLLLIPITVKSYADLGLNTILKIDFDSSPTSQLQSDLILQLAIIVIGITLFTYVLLQVLIGKFVLKGVVSLRTQINNKRVGDGKIIKVNSNDEIAQVADEVNVLMMNFEQQLEKNKVLIEISNTDALTCLANRRHFDQKMQIEWSQAQRDKSLFSLIMIDIDKFKNFNDTYGHETGDTCLKAVAQMIKQQLQRPRDFVARLGGEEFICILPNTDKEGAAISANKVLSSIYNLNIEHASSPVANVVTVSVGCLTVKGQQQHSIVDLLDKVDKLLYQAKNSGRNKVCTKYIN